MRSNRSRSWEKIKQVDDPNKWSPMKLIWWISKTRLTETWTEKAKEWALIRHFITLTFLFE